MSQKMYGIAASSGIAIGKAILLKTPKLMIETKTVEDVSLEMKRLQEAIEKSKADLIVIRDKVQAEMGPEKAAIFSAHLLVLDDPELLDAVNEKMRSERVNAESALNDVSQMYIEMFENMDNEYMKERGADIRDISKRVLHYLLGLEYSSLSNLSEEVILIAEDLTPSDTAQLDRQYVKGFVTDIGGRTSHSAIMARSLEIPAVVGTKSGTEEIQAGTQLILDGINGLILIDPTEDEIVEYQEQKADFELRKAKLAKLVNSPSVTKDGHSVELAANIGRPEDVVAVLENGAQGIGLFRTEFLYMGRDEFPSEEEQFQAYKSVVEQMGDKPVVIRTLDIGGDKQLSYMELPKELNPFLGFRAIRLCLDQQELFRIQLRALLRASAYGNLKIMFPMISTLGELRKAKEILEEEKKELIRKGIAVSKKLEIGIMVEIPATAVMADRFSKEVDFFSIGTNDLVQYTMAADRMNEQVAYLYQPYNPAILRLVQMVIKAAHQEGKWVGMCGEMAGDEIAIPILIGLGLDEFSMSATSILAARSQIGQMAKGDVDSHIDHILSMDTADEVSSYVKTYFLK
ncbi:MAG TPA: phosphoenolpyruvate--protein phosphotransferase [Bacillota bacterium]|nr:phosphoenolpyruvate--protein phosphotransferase [Bacillota bacterium]